MAGSPKKRAKKLAKKEAERKASAVANAASDTAVATEPAGEKREFSQHPSQPASEAIIPYEVISPPAPVPLQGEILPPVKDEDVTRTALRRAMRRKAAEYAEEAIEVLAKNLKSQDPEIAAKAANDILKHSGVTEPDKQGGVEGLVVQILKMGSE